MNRQALLTQLAETERRISNAEARLVVLTAAIVSLSEEGLLPATAQLRSAHDALDVMRQYQSALLEELAQDDAE
jgi:hypothetical protein